MKGGFFAGMALGAMVGSMFLQMNPQAKKVAEDGTKAVTDQLKNLGK